MRKISFLFIISAFFLSSCMTQKDIIKMCSNRCQAELENAEVILFEEDKINFLGDGDEWIIIDLSKSFNKFENAIRENKNWKFCHKDEVNIDISHKYFEIPEEGYYCIIDWQQPEGKKFDSSQINAEERYSYNYTVMIYDPATKKIYSYSLDT